MTSIMTLMLILTQLSSPAVTGTLPNALVSFWGETEEYHETYKVKPGTMLQLSNANGDIEMTTWEQDHVDVYAIKETTRGKDELAKVQINVLQGDVMKIETRYLEHNVRVSVHYRIKVPVHIVGLEIETSNGDIELNGMKVETRVVTANGDINIKDMSSSVRAQTSNGDVNIEGETTIADIATSNGDVAVEIHQIQEQGASVTTSNGSIDLYIKEDLHADVAVTTALGDVTVRDVSLGSRLTVRKKSSTMLKGQIGDGGSLLKVQTAMGDVTLHTLRK
jgi:hypothetical protein